MTGIQKKQRLLTMIFGAFAIFFTGYPHVWSIYQPYVMEQAGWSQGQASMCFYLALSTFVFGNIVGGRMQNRFKEKTIVWIGGGIFAAGILASTFLIVPTPLPMYLSYGVMQGFGQGLIYTVILATVQRWFPNRTGFASGIPDLPDRPWDPVCSGSQRRYAWIHCQCGSKTGASDTCR